MFRQHHGAAMVFTICTAAFTADRASAADPGRARSETIEQLVITASPLSRGANDIATIVGQVTRTEIMRSGGTSLADVLGEVPGVTGSGFASGASRPVIRGFDANRVRILENGVGSFDVSDVGPDHGVPVDPLSAQKIEVVRGAATLRFGSQAIGGVVNAINNRIPLARVEKAVAGEFSASYATNADSPQGSALIDAGTGPLAFHADGFVRRTGDYAIPGGLQPNSYFRGAGASFGSSYFFDDSRVGAAIIHYDSQYGLPGETSYIDMRQTKGVFGSSFTLEAGALKSLNFDGGYADYEHGEIEPAGKAVLATFIDKEWDSRAEALFSAVGPLSEAALGVQLQDKDFSALGTGGDYLFPTSTKNAAVFGFAEAPLGPDLRLQFGARVERVKVEGTPASNVVTDRRFTPVSGSAGLIFDASENVDLGLTFATAARAPAHTELFARGPHDGPATFETGDPTLAMERANSVEGTIRVRAASAEIEGTVWGAKFNNYIFGRLTGRTCDEGGNCAVGNGEDLKEMLYQQRDASYWGLEGKATLTLYEARAGTVAGLVIADYVRAKLEGAGNVPRTPPYHLSAGLAWNSERFDTSFLVRQVGRQTKVAFAETPTEGYVSLDAQATWRPFSEKPDIELSIVGRNLTDVTQRNAVSFNKDEVPLPGRDVRFLVRAAF